MQPSHWSLTNLRKTKYFHYNNSPSSIYENSNMTPRLSGYISLFGLVFFASSLFWELRDNGVVKNLQICL